jgi:hypothetical protein
MINKPSERQTARKRKRVCWPKEFVTKEETVVVSERLKFNKICIELGWRDYVQDDVTRENTNSNIALDWVTESVKRENFQDHIYMTNEGELITHPAKSDIFDIKKNVSNNYLKYKDSIGFLVGHFVQTTNVDYSLYPKDVISECVDYLKFKIEDMEDKGSTMICWATGSAATQPSHLDLLRRNEKCISQHLTYRRWFN